MRAFDKDKLTIDRKLQDILEKRGNLHGNAKKYRKIFFCSDDELKFLGFNSDLINSQRLQFIQKYRLLKSAEKEVYDQVNCLKTVVE